MAFNKEEIRLRYSTDKNNVLKDFYIPVLRESVLYDRAVVHFSSQGLLKYLQGIDGLVENNGKMRLIIGDTLTDDEYLAIRNSNDYKDVFERLDSTWSDILNHNQFEELEKYRLEIFSWLLNRGFLEIRYAFRRQGLLQQKIGIATDDEGSVIAFSSPISEAQIVHRPNKDNPSIDSEEFPIFPSWIPEVFELYGKPYVEDFEELWASKDTVDLPSRQYEEIKKIYTSEDAPKSKIEQKTAELYDRLLEEFQSQPEILSINTDPNFPEEINGQKYVLKDHQKDALSEWKANDFLGVLALATGSGKTITAIHSSVAISRTGGGDLAVIVSVPYVVLADQWCEVFRLFNINPIKCYISTSEWRMELQKEIANFNLIPAKNFLAIVVVNKTLVSEQFQEEIKKIEKSKLFFIGDECHHHASQDTIKKLPNARYRMGLSATPWSGEGEKKDLLTKYYSRIVSRYSIDKAIREGVLVGYNYHLNKVGMSGEEYSDYDEKTKEINKLVAIKNNGGNINQKRLTMLAMERLRILGSLDDKFREVEQLLIKRKDIGKNTLFYCGDGSVEDKNEALIRDVSRLALILEKQKWKTSRFTAEESHTKRIGILSNLKNNDINAIVAIRVLDEGFDIPQCEEAFLIASSRNARQFIQRRGRVLRTSPNTGKTKAEIQDFIVLPVHKNSKNSKELVRKELCRAYEFSRVAINKELLFEELRLIAGDYKINLDELMKEEDIKRELL